MCAQHVSRQADSNLTDTASTQYNDALAHVCISLCNVALRAQWPRGVST
jgi:hypothetical protein